MADYRAYRPFPPSTAGAWLASGEEGPVIRGRAHSPRRCGSRGSLGRCEDCHQRIYFWTCACVSPTKLPFEAWENGIVPEGEFRFHNEGYCTLTYEERRARQIGERFEGSLVLVERGDWPSGLLAYEGMVAFQISAEEWWDRLRPGTAILHLGFGRGRVIRRRRNRGRLMVSFSCHSGLEVETEVSDDLAVFSVMPSSPA